MKRQIFSIASMLFLVALIILVVSCKEDEDDTITFSLQSLNAGKIRYQHLHHPFFKRLQIKTDVGIKGSVYVPYAQELPDKLTLLAEAAE